MEEGEKAAFYPSTELPGMNTRMCECTCVCACLLVHICVKQEPRRLTFQWLSSKSTPKKFLNQKTFCLASCCIPRVLRNDLQAGWLAGFQVLRQDHWCSQPGVLFGAPLPGTLPPSPAPLPRGLLSSFYFAALPLSMPHLPPEV